MHYYDGKSADSSSAARDRQSADNSSAARDRQSSNSDTTQKKSLYPDKKGRGCVSWAQMWCWLWRQPVQPVSSPEPVGTSNEEDHEMSTGEPEKPTSAWELEPSPGFVKAPKGPWVGQYVFQGYSKHEY